MKDYNKILQKFYLFYVNKHPLLLERFQDKKFVLYLYAIFTLLVSSFFIAFVIRPTILTIVELRQEFTENQEIMEQFDEKLAAISSLESQTTQFSSEIELLNTAIPTSSPQIPLLTRKIENLANAQGVVLQELEFGSIEVYPAIRTESPFFSFQFQITVEGNESETNSFLADLISFDRVISVDRVSSANVQDGRQGVFIVGRAYFYSM